MNLLLIRIPRTSVLLYLTGKRALTNVPEGARVVFRES